ncbi:MAG: metalloregulator ArsR/SmtB family transcription factor [bacterium]|jgi:DNA-binding transcriptional ArsR family regulator|nr:metalloregulator ArsR/SmtB family transcription factor [bacterium]
MGDKTIEFTDEILNLIAQRFKAMSDPTRLRILHLLRGQEMSVGEIAEAARLKHGTASANLMALYKAGLVAHRKEGTKVLYRIGNPMVFKVCDGVCESLKEEFVEMERIRMNLEAIEGRKEGQS